MLSDVSRQFSEAATGIADVDAYLNSKDLFKNAIDVITAPIKAQQDMLSGLSARSGELQSMLDNASRTNLAENEIVRIKAQLIENTYTMIGAYEAQRSFNKKYGVVISGAEQLIDLINSKTIDAGVSRLPELISDYSSAFASVSQETNEALGLIVSTVNQNDASSVYGSFLRLNTLYEDGALTASQYAKVIETIEKVYEEGTDTIEKAYARLKNAEKTYEQIAQERIALEDQLNQLMLSSDELRALELSKIDESNRYLQERIWQLLDEKAAQEEATRAQEEAAQAAENLSNAWSDATSSIQEEINRILGIGAGNALTYQQAQSQFSQATAMALLGDKQAAADLPAFSRTMLELAETQARTAEELALIKGQTAASLVDTLSNINLGLMDKAPFIQVPAFADGGIHQGGIRLVGENGPELEVTGSSRIFNAQQTQAILKGSNNNNADVVAELKAVRAELAQSRKERNQLLSILNEQTKNVADNTEYLMVWDSSTLPPMAAT